MVGFVSIVGAGPWNPELLTVGARARLERADVVVVDYLVNPALLLHCRPDCVIHQRVAGPRHGAYLDQDKINDRLVEDAQAGHYVVRLKGGDPCMFGRGGEEAQILAAAGIPFELLPGVSSPIAAPEFAGIPVTHRSHTPAVTFVSGYEAYEKAGLRVAWEHLAQSAGTLVLMMSVRNAGDNALKLIEAGREPTTPAAVVRWGTRGIQRTVVGTLADIADKIEAEGIRAPAVLVIGDVVSVRDQIAFWEKRPLHGRRIVVTRASRQASGLVDQLSADGADVVPFPCLDVVPPQGFGSLDRGLAALGRDFDGLILTSPNGVDAFFDALERCGIDLRRLTGVDVAVVGESSARACRKRGLIPDLVPDDARSEGLAEALRDRHWLGRRWLHVRAAEGRDVLQDAITEAGGTYELAVGYRTIRPHLPPMLIRSLLPPEDRGEGFDLVVFASGKTARHFVTALRDEVGDAKAAELVKRARAVTIGPVTTRAVEELGFSVAAEATEATEDGLLGAVRVAVG